jgi:tetratricopeptide (TPR) repeat protein
MALSRELLARGRQTGPHLLLAELEIQKRNFTMAAHHIKEAMGIKTDDPNLWAMKGHIYYIQGKWHEAKEAYEQVLTFTERNDHFATVYHRLGMIYLKQAINVSKDHPEVDSNLALQSKKLFLEACNLKPTSQSWLGAGRAAFALKEIDEAEDAYAVKSFS